mgnify:CR=1 FL=1
MNNKIILPYNIEKKMSIAARKEYYKDLKRYCIDNVVPNIISGKDLDYLSDMFNWNFNAFKLINDFKEKVSDEEIKDLIERVCKTHKENLNAVLNILS